LRAPQVLQQASASDDAVTLENYDDTDYGYLRILVDARQLRIEYHPASDGAVAKTPDDSVTIDIATRKQTIYTPNDLGLPASAKAVHALYTAQAPGTAPKKANRKRAAKRGR
jgi:hypothetical protein